MPALVGNAEDAGVFRYFEVEVTLMRQWCLLVILFWAQASVFAADRVALVIGNTNYTNAQRLSNPVNDARDMAVTLKKLGFTVQEHHDLTESQMHRAIRNFGDSLNKGDTGLFYFSGHGVQVQGKNYLIPVQADIRREDEVPFQAIDAAQILAKMESASAALKIMILDACRDNPYASEFKSDTKGLARMYAPMGTVLAYATAPGKVASDNRRGRNGLFTKHLLKRIQQPGLNISEVLRLTRKDVVMESKRLQHRQLQIPWESSSLLDPFCFAGCKAKITDNTKMTNNKNSVNTHSHPAVPGCTQSVEHTHAHQNGANHTHSYSCKKAEDKTESHVAGGGGAIYDDKPGHIHPSISGCTDSIRHNHPRGTPGHKHRYSCKRSLR